MKEQHQAPFSKRALRAWPATPARWTDLEKLFGPRGACAGCWCMWFRLSNPEFRRGKGAGNRRALRDLVRGRIEPGLIAYHGKTPIGWIAVAPRDQYPRLDNSRTWQRVDDQPVWSVSCFYVVRDYRRRGLTSWMLTEAVRYAARRGARIVEGYPTQPKGGHTADAFIYTGVPSAFRRAGFREVLRRSPSRPIMRRFLRRAKTQSPRREVASAPRKRTARGRG